MGIDRPRFLLNTELLALSGVKFVRAVGKRRGPPTASGVLKGRAMATESARELSWAVGAFKVVGGTVVKIVGALSRRVGAPCCAEQNVFGFDLSDGAAFVAECPV